MVGDSLGEGQESLGDEDGESGEGEEDGGEESKDRMVGVCLSLVVEHHPEVGEMVAVADSQSERQQLQIFHSMCTQNLTPCTQNYLRAPKIISTFHS